MNCRMAISMAMFLAAVGLAIVAEVLVSRRSASVAVEGTTIHCLYSMDKATVICGLAALCLLVLAQFIMAITSKCICCTRAIVLKKPGKTKIAAILVFILSWIFFTLSALALLVASILASLKKENYGEIGTAVDISCGEKTRKGIFAAAAALTIVTLICTQSFLALDYRARRDIFY